MMNQFVDMKPVSFELLDGLVRTSGVCVSLYVPAYQKGAGTPRSDVLLRSLAGQARERLLARGVSALAADDLLSPIIAMSHEEPFQRGHATCLAMFRSTDRLEVFALGGAVDGSVHVGARFHVLPVLRQLAVPVDFLVLALTRKTIRLLRGTPEGFSAVPLPASIPATLAQFLAFDQPDHRLENRSSGGPQVGAMKGISFGTGSEAEAHNLHFRDYCLAIDRGLRAMNAVPKPPPLVAMGATSEVSIFCSASEYPNLAEPILRSPDDGGLTDEEVETKVRAWLASTPSADEFRAAGYVEKALGSKLAVPDLSAILRFAHKGRLDILFLAAGESMVGAVEPLTGENRSIGDGSHALDEDLYNAAAVETLKHSGAVWVVPRERVPGGVLAIAKLRY